MKSRILDILILQDKTLFGAFEVSNIVCWLVNQPIAKLDLFKSPDCRWICETYVEYCYRNSATVRRLVQSPTLQSTISCGVHSDSRGKGIRVSPAWWNASHARVFCAARCLYAKIVPKNGETFVCCMQHKNKREKTTKKKNNNNNNNKTVFWRLARVSYSWFCYLLKIGVR